MLCTFSGLALSILSPRKLLDVFEEKGVSRPSSISIGKSAVAPARVLARGTDDTFLAMGRVLLFGDDGARSGELGGE